MNYLHLFENRTAHDTVYNGGGYKEPWSAYIKDDKLVTYNKGIGYKNIVGSIIYAESNGTLKATSKEKWNSSLGTPVAVVVIPASHMSDGKCRGVSLCNMSYKTPQTGTLGIVDTDAETNGTNLVWGARRTDVDGLTNYTSVKTIDGTNSSGYFPSDLFDGDYGSGATDATKCVSPYNDDGSQNPAYLTAGQVLADMDGKVNTEVLVNLSAIKDTYSDGSFENIEANYPAAFACHLFSTQGTSQGDWYLPAVGELGYLCTRVKKINESLAALGTSAVQVGTELNDSFSFGGFCWSSSEHSTDIAWYIAARVDVGANYKHYGGYPIRVRAFAAFDI